MNYQKMWELTAYGTFFIAIVMNVALFFYPGTVISAGEQIVISIMLLIPAMLHFERTATLESIRKMVEGSVHSNILISNRDIWNSYHRLVNLTPDRDHIRAINFYTNIDGGKAVESEEARHFYEHLSKKAKWSRDVGGHITLRFLGSTAINCQEESIAIKRGFFEKAGIAESFQSRIVDKDFPIDIIIGQTETVIVDIPEVEGDPVQGLGIEIRDKRVRDAFANWFDVYFWKETRPHSGMRGES